MLDQVSSCFFPYYPVSAAAVAYPSEIAAAAAAAVGF
jgi:hypothetical protein